MAAIGFPFTVDDAGRIAIVRDPVVEARNEIINCIMTSFRERPMRPTYGGGVRDVVFEPMNQQTVAELQERLLSAVKVEVPSVAIARIGVRKNPSEDGRMDVVILFSLKQDIESQVYTASVTVDGVVYEEA